MENKLTANAAIESLRAQGATIVAAKTAKRAAKKAPGQAVYSDAGDGWVSEWTFCPRRNRVVVVSIAPNGSRIV